MKKVFALAMALLLAFTVTLPASADIIWEPYGNSFYESHRNECSHHERSYLANGEKGYVTVRTAPDSLTEIVNLANGTRFFVIHTWKDKDGTQWGVGYPAGQFDSEGWVKLSEMAMVYDYISFEEDHGHEYTSYDRSAEGLTEACTYSYPGGVHQGKVGSWESGSFDLSDCFDILYTDENGLRWSFVGYYYGHKRFWVCIDDPLNENLGIETYLTVGQVRNAETLIPSVESPDPDAKEEQQPYEELIPPAESIPVAKTWYIWAVPVVLILVVVMITAIIVRKRRKAA